MKKLTNITGIILFIVIAFCFCKVNGQNSIHKKMNKKKVHITTSPAGLSDIHITYNGTPLTTSQLNAGSQTLVKPNSQRILKYLPYAGIALSILLAVFLFIRKRDEVVTLPDEFN